MTPTIRAAAILALTLAGVTSAPRAEEAASATAPVTVLFETSRAAFDVVGLEAIASAARAALRDGSGAVLVEGHTDTLGDAGFNLDLSARRARAVREDLIARGLTVAATDTLALGETRLAVATGDGVAEPQNRRVVITRAAPGALPPPDFDTPIRFPLP